MKSSLKLSTALVAFFFSLNLMNVTPVWSTNEGEEGPRGKKRTADAANESNESSDEDDKPAKRAKGSELDFDALDGLWNDGDEADKEAARPGLYAIAQNPTHENHRDVLYMLWDDGNDADKEAARPGLHTIAQNNFHEDHGDVLNILWSEYNEADQAIARDGFTQIMSLETTTEYRRRDIIRLFRESNGPQDQAQGLEWKLRYFPFVYSPELQRDIDQFNLKTFKNHAPQALKDLSEIEIDITDRISALIVSIETTDETVPNYLHILSVTGDRTGPANNTVAFGDLKNKAVGFFKTLEGKVLEAGESGGWQMHDTDKPGLINAMKHIILSLEGEEDVRTRLNNLGIVLNGILHCPTGQAEGVNTAVNTLMRGKNRGAGSFEEVMAKVIFDAINTAFIQAFGEGSGVHAYSRARTVLHPHIGLPQAVTGFVERISRVTDEEIPEILQNFYRFFTPDFLSEFVLNNLQTQKDNDRYVTMTPAERERIKQERPLASGYLTGWLTSHGLNPSDFGIEMDDETSSLTYKTTASHIKTLLEKMGWLNPAPEAIS